MDVYMSAGRRMTPAQFEMIQPLLRISDNRKKAARLALVDGVPLRLVGEQLGCSKQAVWDAVNIVWRTLNDYYKSQREEVNSETILPPGWARVTLVAPIYLIEKIIWSLKRFYSNMS